MIKPSTPLGHSDPRALKLLHGRCIDTALLFHHPRGRPLKPGLAWLTRKWIGHIIQDRGPGGHNLEEDARTCIDLLLKAKVRLIPTYLYRDHVDAILRFFRARVRRVPSGF
jgi:hypothetical protein